MCTDKEQELAELKHIQNILEERVLWYKKRQLETKRAMKAKHRLSTLPDPVETYTMLEAELSYSINRIGFEVLCNVINRLAEQNSSFTKKQLSKEFIKQLLEKEELFVKEQLSEAQYSKLFDVVFSLDENYQRTVMADFVLDFAEQLITKIFRNIVIFDESYTKEVIERLVKHLKKNQ
ncbi:MAG: hypothetical protein KGD59_03170 [Candidatus Heimdallarchaeota archaeon]|nr:hypothetical protein [Candidatus Heimdallarchaeota archaeon]MBY8993524.1 hypothetical protein [Candidatus Heimdallarchaeota archaeon]